MSSPVFPSSIPPDWISSVNPGQRASSSTTFDSGAVSRLRITGIRSEASFQATWNFLEPAKRQILVDFWELVESIDGFTLPVTFFNREVPAFIKRQITESSPLGRWRIEEEPTLETHSTRLVSITMVFVSDIDPA